MNGIKGAWCLVGDEEQIRSERAGDDKVRVVLINTAAYKTIPGSFPHHSRIVGSKERRRIGLGIGKQSVHSGETGYPEINQSKHHTLGGVALVRNALGSEAIQHQLKEPWSAEQLGGDEARKSRSIIS